MEIIGILQGVVYGSFSYAVCYALPLSMFDRNPPSLLSVGFMAGTCMVAAILGVIGSVIFILISFLDWYPVITKISRTFFLFSGAVGIVSGTTVGLVNRL